MDNFLNNKKLVDIKSSNYTLILTYISLYLFSSYVSKYLDK